MTLNNKVKGNIIKSTINTAWKKGYAATSVQEIVKNAGAPKGSIYYYFPKGKDEIFIESLNKVNSVVKKEFSVIANHNHDLQSFLEEVFALFTKKKKVSKNNELYITLLALETLEVSPIVSEKCSSVLEEWRSRLAYALFDRGIPEEICNPVSEWLFMCAQGSVCAAKIHRDELFLDNINSAIKLVSNASKDLLKEIFTKPEEQ